MVVLRVRVIVTIILNYSSQSRLSLEIDGFQYLPSSSTGAVLWSYILTLAALTCPCCVDQSDPCTCRYSVDVVMSLHNVLCSFTLFIRLCPVSPKYTLNCCSPNMGFHSIHCSFSSLLSLVSGLEDCMLLITPSLPILHACIIFYYDPLGHT